jgi:hypothetical protein
MDEELKDPWHYPRPKLAEKYLKVFDIGLIAAPVGPVTTSDERWAVQQVFGRFSYRPVIFRGLLRPVDRAR